MICQNCKKFEFFNELEHYFVKSNLCKPLEYFSEYATENCEENLVCDNCGEEILVGDLYYEDEGLIEDAKDDLFKELAKVVMLNIAACEECEHGQLLSDIRYRVNKTFNEEDESAADIYKRFHSSTELNDLIYNVTGFDDYYEEIVNHISCPHCRNGSGENYDEKFDHGRFNLYTEVYTNEDIAYFEEKFYGEAYVEIKHEIERIADVCSYEELERLKQEFLNNPIFISRDSTFEKIYKLLKRLYKQKNYLLLHKSMRLYRARVNEGTELFPADKMWEAPVEKTRQNRYNLSGLPVLYCANSKDVLYKEVPDPENKGYTFANMRLLKPYKMFKINAVFGYKFHGFIEEPVPKNCENNAFKTQYIMTNIIALITKEIGFDGIVYLSVKDKRYINYAVFNYDKNSEIEIMNTSRS
jgi:hypothetical protein